MRCERRHADVLTERDIPDWWEELTVTGLTGLRPRTAAHTADAATDDAGEVVARMSAAWRGRELRAARELTDDGDAGAGDE